jgi:hypothetical protein
VRRALILGAALAIPAGHGLAQPAPAPVPPPAAATQQTLGDNLFRERAPQEGDEDIAAGRIAPPQPDTTAPAAAPSGRKPEPGTAASGGYDSRVIESFQAAERFQGPLDGGWTLAAKGGAPLYAVRFVDHAGKLEAAWRDLRRTGALDASGVVDEVARDGGRLSFRFTPMTGVTDVATLTAGAGGVWTGELDEAGRKRAVTLAKTSP